MNQGARLLRCLTAGMVPGALPALLVAFLLSTAPARSDAFDSNRTLTIENLQRFAEPFLGNQGADGAYRLGPRVQRHLKAEIGMALTAQATGNVAYAESALRDLRWVIANRMEADGGLNWDGPENPYFFECHQHWFLLASELIQEVLGPDDGIRTAQAKVWQYLTANNPASADFYVDNQQHWGPFFAYRNVDRNGTFQNQAPFKGSYEVGAALWSLSLHRDSSWLETGTGKDGNRGVAPAPLASYAVSQYLNMLVEQVKLPVGSHGFGDPSGSLWVRSLLWSGHGWQGWEGHDWKYSLHMQEGALLYQILTGATDMEGIIRGETENLAVQVTQDGSIPSIPDAFGSANYEYGEALSALGLAAVAFRFGDPDLGNRSLEAAERVARYVVENLAANSDEDGAILLAGLARVYRAQFPDTTLTSGNEEIPTDLPSGSLRVWPNPAHGSVSLGYLLPDLGPGRLRVIDATGRERASITLDAGRMNDGTLLWNPMDDAARPLPSGHYSIVMEVGGRRASQGLVILR
jgi:hypothetical protein